MSKINKIALCAEAFGFGPSSKAAAIAHRLRQFNIAEPVILSDALAFEYLKREGFNGLEPLNPKMAANVSIIHEVIRDCKAAVVVLSPDWVKQLFSQIPIVYVDSLGFMWDEELFNTYDELRHVDCYVSQDVFEATSSLRRHKIKNLYSVGAITNISQPNIPLFKEINFVIHLGGLFNIFSKVQGIEYAYLVSKLINSNVPTEKSVVLMSELARQNIAVFNDFDVRSVNHIEAINLFVSATTVFTSPGLTSLLELASLQIPVVPLPPQNYSQAIIISEISKRFKHMPEIWNMLAHIYKVSPNVSEEEGVSFVRKLNIDLTNSEEFIQDYRLLSIKACEAKVSIPKLIVDNYNGTQKVVNIIQEILNR